MISNSELSSWIILFSLLSFTTCKDTKKTEESPTVEVVENHIETDDPFFKISLAQWSLHLKYQADDGNPLEFAKDTKELGLDAVEYVSDLYNDEISEMGFDSVINTLKSHSEKYKVTNVLIMIDGEGDLADPDNDKRTEAIEKHKKWVDAAAILGCHSVRVNTFGTKDPAVWINSVQDGLRRLSEYAATKNINVLVENHGWLSSNAPLVMEAIKGVNMTNCGTLPDFGNWCVIRKNEERWGECLEEYPDMYDGVSRMMPAAKAVSAKSYAFDEAGNETKIDYSKMLQIVKDAGYTGHIGIEFEGDIPEEKGIALTKSLLQNSAIKLN